MSLDYYALKLNHLALAVLLIGALVGCYRTRRCTLAMQLVGAVCLVAAIVIGYLMPIQPEPGTHNLRLGAAWRAQVVLSCVGLMTFAIGYALEQSRGPKS